MAENTTQASQKTRYMVIMAYAEKTEAAGADVPAGEEELPAIVVAHNGYQELGWFTAWAPGPAKEQALAEALIDAKAGRTDEEVQANAKTTLQIQLERAGVALRAIPERSWPVPVEASSVYVPEPELRIR